MGVCGNSSVDALIVILHRSMLNATIAQVSRRPMAQGVRCWVMSFYDMMDWGLDYRLVDREYHPHPMTRDSYGKKPFPSYLSPLSFAIIPPIPPTTQSCTPTS